ncbi:hypothetical protein GCM10009691_09360 [Brevibacterium picturae]|uniref:Uncharacterized protein n=1 Tax=Brevibacterium picturae TaxID=260553 RepID=A0ABP4M263_9MICO
MAVTIRAGETPEGYFARIRSNRNAVLIKTADLEDNTDPARQALLDEETRVRLGEKHRRAYELLGVDPGLQAESADPHGPNDVFCTQLMRGGLQGRIRLPGRRIEHRLP